LYTLFRARHTLSIDPQIVQISPKLLAQQLNLSGQHFGPLPHCFHRQSRLSNHPLLTAMVLPEPTQPFTSTAPRPASRHVASTTAKV
jgi:hypothetical protein